MARFSIPLPTEFLIFPNTCIAIKTSAATANCFTNNAASPLPDISPRPNPNIGTAAAAGLVSAPACDLEIRFLNTSDFVAVTASDMPPTAAIMPKKYTKAMPPPAIAATVPAVFNFGLFPKYMLAFSANDGL